MEEKQSGPAPSTPQHDSYPVKTVSRLTGLSPDLIRAWERRYGVVTPVRGPRGARLYTAEDIAHLRLLAAMVAKGRAIGDIAGLGRSTLEAMLAATQEEESREETANGDAPGQNLVEQVLDALSRFDSVEVERLLGAGLVAMGTSSFIREVGAPLLTEVGERWSQGRLSVAEEHLVSGLLRGFFGGLSRLRGARRSPVVLLAAPTGERHEFGLSLASLLFLEAGLGVSYLGVDLPAKEIVDAAKRTGVLAVGLSLVNGENRRQAEQEVESIERSLPAHVELWLGGRDAPEVARGLSHSRALVCRSMIEMEEHIRRLRELRGPVDH